MTTASETAHPAGFADTLAEHSLSASGGSMTTVAGPGALAALTGLIAHIAPEGEIVILSDGAPKTVAGSAVMDAVIAVLPAGRTARCLVAAESGHGVVLDETTIAEVSTRARGAAVVVSVGSGTVSDLGKVVAAAVSAPLISVQTAASVNGFADPLSVVVVKGAKRTVPTLWPSALVIDHGLVAEAPAALTRAGVGDAVAIWSAPADWYLACEIGMDPGRYDDRFVEPVKRIAPRLSDGSVTEADRIAALIEVLTVGGLVIGDAGTTAPLSGVEHLVSHVLDMAAMAEDSPHDLHGAQVGVASILSAALWDIALHEEKILDADPADFAVPEGLRERVLATWASCDPSGVLGEECWSAVQKKMGRWNDEQPAVRAFFAERDRHRARLDELAGDPAEPAAALALWGAPRTFLALTPAVSPERARWALAALPFMRDRMSLADLLVLRGCWNDELFDRVFARAADVGGGL
ncbi:iron-containing alcohol dehydrogenase [Herbiconiux sp.]|uniref:iron-containing alcohol dehydrogenase n=1 Tax=Herbiconiux sp. TaxID=1871186 RepID=UPI0025B9CA49|nr:iron-containing alcohol dehydrogenase [Herbiconiux sp.]